MKGPHPPGAKQPLKAQFSGGAHALHDIPPPPQASFDSPDMHTPPLQQPVQFHEPQARSDIHAPPWQVSPDPQDEQTSPPLPHTASLNPEWQTPPLQHPEQLEGEQRSRTQAPLIQVLSMAQEIHELPPPPQAASEFPALHESPSQHPGQLSGEQGSSAAQELPSHEVPVPQL